MKTPAARGASVSSVSAPPRSAVVSNPFWPKLRQMKTGGKGEAFHGPAAAAGSAEHPEIKPEAEGEPGGQRRE